MKYCGHATIAACQFTTCNANCRRIYGYKLLEASICVVRDITLFYSYIKCQIFGPCW